MKCRNIENYVVASWMKKPWILVNNVRNAQCTWWSTMYRMTNVPDDQHHHFFEYKWVVLLILLLIIIISYSFNVRDPKTHTVFQASALARVGPPVIFLQAQRSCAISSFIPIAFMSLLTQLLHVFLGAPLSTTPITFILVHFFTQLFSSFRSTCPNHLNLPLCILFSTHSMPKRFKSSSLRFLSFKDTPHILLTIILSALLNLARSSRFYSPSLATIYQHSLYTGIIYFSLQFQRDTPFCQHWR